MSRLQKQENTFFGGAAILAAGALIVKIIGAFYKVPLANAIGPVGNGYFYTAYNIYSFFLTLSTAGLPVALSKSVAEANALGRHNQVKRTFRVAQATFLVLGLLCSAAMLFGSGWLAAWMGNTGARIAILALSPGVLFVCAMSSYRGYAQGHGDMRPTSISQIVEAVLKLAVGLGLAMVIMRSALSPEEFKVEIAAAGAILGVTLGALVSLGYLAFNYFRAYRNRHDGGTDQADSSGSILTNIAKIAIPITLGQSIVAIVTMIDTGLVQRRLQDALGLTEAASGALYGIYQAAIPFYSLPSYFMVPLTASIIPAVSAALARRNSLKASRVSESAMRVAALIAMPMGFGIAALGTSIFSLFYSTEFDPSIGGPLLSVLGIASILVSITLICTSILQANGFVNLPIITSVVGGVVKVIVNYILVGNPAIGIYGAPVGTLCCFAAVAVLDIIIILRVIPNPPNFLRAFGKPLAASLLMGGAAWAVNGLLSNVAGARLAVVGGVLTGGAVYLILVVVLRVLSAEDMALMPKGEKIARFLRL